MNSRINGAPVVIIGGGVAGLTAASLLAHKGFDVAIFEASDKLGGSCATTTLGGYSLSRAQRDRGEGRFAPFAPSRFG